MLTDRSLAWVPSERPNKQLMESEADTYTQPMDRSPAPVVKLGNGSKKLRRRVEDRQSQLSWTPKFSQTLIHQRGSIH